MVSLPSEPSCLHHVALEHGRSFLSWEIEEDKIDSTQCFFFFFSVSCGGKNESMVCGTLSFIALQLYNKELGLII